MTNALRLFQQLSSGKKQVEEGIRYDNLDQVKSGVENISLLMGRMITETSVQRDTGILGQCMMLLLESQEALKMGSERLEQIDEGLTVDTRVPSDWMSFDGSIKAPLYVSKSTIKNAGHGLFTQNVIERGECIGPTRTKVDSTGDFFKDWLAFPMAKMLNHHPIPNCKIVRAGPPFAVNSKYTETCYLVATRHIEIGEELTTDYRDKGWAEWDYWTHLDLPFEEWDKNAMRGMVQPETQSLSVMDNKAPVVKSAAALGASSLFYASTLTKGIPAHLLALCGVAVAGYTVYDKVK